MNLSGKRRADTHSYENEWALRNASKQLNSSMITASKNHDFVSVKKFYDQAKQKGLRDDILTGSFIKIADNMGETFDARAAYEEAVRTEIAGTATFNTFIGVLGKKNYVKEALEVYEQAKKKHAVNKVTLNTLIHICSKDSAYERKTKFFFNVALEMQWADQTTFQTFMLFAQKKTLV